MSFQSKVKEYTLIYSVPYLEGENMDSFLFKEYQREMKCKQCRPGFEPESLVLSLANITITLNKKSVREMTNVNDEYLALLL